MSEITQGLGLLLPDKPVEGTFPNVCKAPGFRLLTMAEVEKITTDPRRTPARKQFGPEWIKSQDNRNSCAGYAGAKALEKAFKLRGFPHVPLSGEGLYAQVNGGSDNGSMLVDGMKAIINRGVPPENMVPHLEYRWNRISQEAKEACKRFRVPEDGMYMIDTEDELASALALGWPTVIALHFRPGVSNRLNAEGISPVIDGPGNHAEHCDDVRVVRGRYLFDTANSHGLSYGQQGRHFTIWDHFRQTRPNHGFYAIATTHDDPQGA